jgi:hypothetical protein
MGKLNYVKQRKAVGQGKIITNNNTTVEPPPRTPARNYRIPIGAPKRGGNSFPFGFSRRDEYLTGWWGEGVFFGFAPPFFAAFFCGLGSYSFAQEQVK